MHVYLWLIRSGGHDVLPRGRHPNTLTGFLEAKVLEQLLASVSFRKSRVARMMMGFTHLYPALILGILLQRTLPPASEPFGKGPGRLCAGDCVDGHIACFFRLHG